MNNQKTPTHYTLIKKYPGCNKPIGYTERYTTGEFSNYPEYWKPVYNFEDLEQVKTPPEWQPKVVIAHISEFIIRSGTTKDTITLGEIYEAEYGIQFFVNTRHLLRRPNLEIKLHGIKLTQEIADKIIKVIEDRMYVVC